MHPIVPVWRDLQDDMAWLPFADLEAQQPDLTLRFQGYEAATLQALTGYLDLVETIHALHV